VSHLTSGGRDVENTVDAVMRKLFTDRLANQITWAGVPKESGKRVFSKMKLREVVFGEFTLS